MTAPGWTDTAVWYAVYPLGMTGALHPTDPSEGHRLIRVEGWLDHLVSLGCNGLLLGPIFTSRSHGYDTLDYFSIDPRLGDDADFDSLVAACHARGIRILLDGVFNHVSQDFPALQSALASPDAPTADWFYIDYSTNPPTRLNFEGSDDLVRLNHSSPGVVKLVGDVMRHWLARGIDGWRLDAAYAVEPHFWATVLPDVRAQYPDALFTGEVIHSDLDRLKASTLESVTAYELWKAIWSSLNDANFFELDWTLTRHDELLDLTRPLTFIGNHDVTRITTLVGPQGAVLAMAVLCTVGGMPSVYYGDEGGLEGTKYERPGGDDEIRPELPASADQWRAPLPWLLDEYRALIALRRRNPWLVNARHKMTELTNQRLVYRSRAGDDWLQVDLDLEDGCSVVISGPQGESYRYESPRRPD